MLVAASLLALSLFGEPKQPACTAPSQTGIFRILALTKDGTNTKLGMILLENVQDCLEATIITEDAGPAIIDSLSVKDNVVSGNVRTPRGTAKITLRIDDSHLAGTIVDGRKEWSLSGHRTSGAEGRAPGQDRR
jgi:hypothetical protein